MCICGGGLDICTHSVWCAPVCEGVVCDVCICVWGGGVCVVCGV